MVEHNIIVLRYTKLGCMRQNSCFVRFKWEKDHAEECTQGTGQQEAGTVGGSLSMQMG